MHIEVTEVVNLSAKERVQRAIDLIAEKERSSQRLQARVARTSKSKQMQLLRQSTERRSSVGRRSSVSRSSVNNSASNLNVGSPKADGPKADAKAAKVPAAKVTDGEHAADSAPATSERAA